MEAQEALRGDDEARQAAALAGLRAAQERMGAVGGLFVLMALDHAGLTVQRKLSRVFGALGVEAYEKAVAAAACVADLAAKCDALTQRVKELERREERRAERQARAADLRLVR